MYPPDTHINGTLVWYYSVCKREVWLMSRQLTPDEDAEPILLGRLIHEMTYRRKRKEVSLDDSRIDIIEKGYGRLIISEIKKSSKYIEAAELQLKYYLSLFQERGIQVEGLLRIPSERKEIKVTLFRDDMQILETVKSNIIELIHCSVPPKPVRIPFCKSCAYSEFCWS